MVVAGTYVRIILNPNLVTFSCIGILYGGLDEWPVNTEISGNHVAICRVGNIPEHGTCTSLQLLFYTLIGDLNLWFDTFTQFKNKYM
jgi:hypothetical protein